MKTFKTEAGVRIRTDLLSNYFEDLVDHFFKILPLWENAVGSPDELVLLGLYMRSLQKELLGCKSLINVLHSDPMMLSLIAILQYFIDSPSCEIPEVKREVFRAISICNKLKDRYAIKEKKVAR